jgi:protein-tyrosine phosphatase
MIENLVDVHSHILPGIDDGSPDVETSLKMIEALQSQGARAIVLTPHYYSDSISYEDFVARRDNALHLLEKSLPPGSPKLIPAAEVYITKYLLNNSNLDALKIGNTDYALIEHPFSCDFSQETYDRLLSLNYDYGIKPILAHIERYPAFMDDGDLLDSYIEMGCIAQVNISSFVDSSRSLRKKLFKYLESGRIHLIGTDCHNLSSRKPDFETGVNAIIKKCGAEAVDVLERNANILAK